MKDCSLVPLKLWFKYDKGHACEVSPTPRAVTKVVKAHVRPAHRATRHKSSEMKSFLFHTLLFNTPYHYVCVIGYGGKPREYTFVLGCECTQDATSGPAISNFYQAAMTDPIPQARFNTGLG